MEIKKNPKSNLENYSKLFIQMGLVLALFVAYVVVEKKTSSKQFSTLAMTSMSEDIEIYTPITTRPEPKIPKQKPPIPDEIIITDEEDIIESIIEPTDLVDEPTEIFVIDSIVEVNIKDDFVEDVPFERIENVPVYPGCKGNNEALKRCFSKKVQKHFSKKFDASLPNELGLSPGKKRVIMQFKVDKNGHVKAFFARAPHPRIEKEVIKILKQLPQMKPGKQRGQAVSVKYTLPMKINVE